jgi:phosphatidylglycerophosphate synthase
MQNLNNLSEAKTSFSRPGTMIDQPFRAWLATRVQPLVRLYQHLGLSPNAITLAGLAFGIFAAIATAMAANTLAIALWWLGRLLDGTDGIYARSSGRVTDFGGYLDILADMAGYSAMIIGFACARPEQTCWWLTILALYVLCITSALSLGSLGTVGGNKGDNRSLRLAAGLAEGGETGLVYTALLVFPSATQSLCTFWVFILSMTVGARTLVAWRVLGEKGQGSASG